MKTDFSELSKDKREFNSDISNWDASNRTDFSRIFLYVFEFNQDEDKLTEEVYFAFDKANADGEKFFKSFGDGTIRIKDE